MEINFRSEPRVDLVDFMGGDNSVARSAWVSFGKDQREDEEGRVEGLIDFLYRERHMTPFESSVFTFRIETPIFVSREIVRHRSSSFNEISGRYTILPTDFYVPTEDRPLKQQGKAGAYHFVDGTYSQKKQVQGDFKRIYEEVFKTYQGMLDAGVAKEVARDILPVGAFTVLYMTVNARNLMHFLTLRSSEQALFEIRQVAGAMEEHFKNKMPLTHQAWSKHG